MLAAAKITRQALGDPTLRPGTTTYKTSPLLLQDDRLERGPAVRLARRHRGASTTSRSTASTSSRSTCPAISTAPRFVACTRWKCGSIRRCVQAPDRSTQARRARAAARPSPRCALPVKAGTRLVGVTFVGSVDQFAAVRDARPSAPPPSSFAYQLNPIDAAVNNIQIVGPVQRHRWPETRASRKRIFVCQPASAEGRGGLRARAF